MNDFGKSIQMIDGLINSLTAIKKLDSQSLNDELQELFDNFTNKIKNKETTYDTNTTQTVAVLKAIKIILTPLKSSTLLTENATLQHEKNRYKDKYEETLQRYVDEQIAQMRTLYAIYEILDATKSTFLLKLLKKMRDLMYIVTMVPMKPVNEGVWQEFDLLDIFSSIKKDFENGLFSGGSALKNIILPTGDGIKEILIFSNKYLINQMVRELVVNAIQHNVKATDFTTIYFEYERITNQYGIIKVGQSVLTLDPDLLGDYLVLNLHQAGLALVNVLTFLTGGSGVAVENKNKRSYVCFGCRNIAPKNIFKIF